MVRQQDGSIKAFYNVCQHRGNPLVDESKGSNPRRFVCRYHSWAFLPRRCAAVCADKEDFP
jgi:phenylpropionate dioxygenase-like ring-hydroxylating dioxygenase large terminal subunit